MGLSLRTISVVLLTALATLVAGDMAGVRVHHGDSRNCVHMVGGHDPRHECGEHRHKACHEESPIEHAFHFSALSFARDTGTSICAMPVIAIMPDKFMAQEPDVQLKLISHEARVDISPGIRSSLSLRSPPSTLS